MHSDECMKRYLSLDDEKSCWIWPQEQVGNQELRELLAITIEIAIK